MKNPSSESVQPEYAGSPDTGTDNRRRAERLEFNGRVRLRVESGEVAGEADNLSGVGLLFTSSAPLRVVVEIDAPEGTRSLNGRLIRVASFGPLEHGFAIEFDADQRAKVRDLVQR